jgi:hypothetical protein
MPTYSLTECVGDLFRTLPLNFQERAQESPMDKGESRVSIKPLTRAGAQVLCGLRQSIPSSNIDNCAGVSAKVPLVACGRTISLAPVVSRTVTIEPQNLDQVSPAASEPLRSS